MKIDRDGVKPPGMLGFPGGKFLSIFDHIFDHALFALGYLIRHLTVMSKFQKLRQNNLIALRITRVKSGS